MTIERFHLGPRMSQVVVHRGTIYLSGQVAETHSLPSGSRPENANKCLTPVYYGRYLGFDRPPHLWGGFAEYVYVDLDMLPGTKIYKLPDMSLRLGS